MAGGRAGRRLLALVRSDFQERAREQLASVIANETVSREIPIATRIGEVRWLHVVVQPVWDTAEGRVVRVLGAAQNVTDRRRVQEAEARADRERRGQQERELTSLERLSGGSTSIQTAQAFGLAPLRSSQPELFEELVGRYQALLEDPLEQRVFRVTHQIPERLRKIADVLGQQRSGPRDVVDLHSHALQRHITGLPPVISQAYTEDGRFLALELMVYLVSYYRCRSIGPRSARAPGFPKTGAGKERV